MTNINERLKEIIVECAENCISIQDINDCTNLITDFEFDSIQIIQLVIEIESNFDLTIDDEFLDPEVLTNFNSLLSLVSRKIQL